jgi:5-methyltetrahydropteroyltriglutamate--homocysteine methyltransferase
MKLHTTIAGYPRIGRSRELKKITESYFSGETTVAALIQETENLHSAQLAHIVKLGLDLIPVGDYSLYDTMLDTSVLFNLIPASYSGLTGIELYFAMARGIQKDKSISARWK